MTAPPVERPACGKCQEPGCATCFPKRTTMPKEGTTPGEAQRPETAMSADAQRGIVECETTMRECRETIADAWVRLERAIERRALLTASQRIVGITYGE